MDLVERLRSGEDGLEYAAADEIERLLKTVDLYKDTCCHTKRTAYRDWVDEHALKEG